jgi:ribosomal protein S18 acetylase RimI-like enzyme
MRRIIVQVLICALPVSVLLALGRAALAGHVLWGIFAVMAFRLILIGRAAELLTLFVALAPLLNLLREFALTYQIIAVVTFLLLAFYASRAPADLWGVVRRFPLATAMMIFVVLYYVASLILTERYDVNLRMYDFAFMVIVVLVIGRSRRMLAAMLLGLMISAWAVGIAMLQHIEADIGSRLGSMMIEGHILGNPVSLGTPLALCFLALALDQGRWCNLQDQPIIRLALIVPTFALLALTTSRAAWLVTTGGIVVALLFDRRSRMRLLLLIPVAAIVMQVILISPYGEGLQAGLDRTFGEERSATNRTSGRSDQWVVSYYALTSSAGNLLHGFGPGMGPRVYARYSREARGITYDVGGEAQLHALYMQVVVEAGLLGFIPFLLWIGMGGIRNFLWMRRSTYIFPFVCFVGYMVIVFTVSGFDSVSGTFLGIGLLATLNRGQKERRKALSIVPLTSALLRRRMSEILRIDNDMIGQRWGESHFTLDRPGKWEVSRLALDPAGHAIGFVIASLPGDVVHIHRLAVAPSQRGKGLGLTLLRAVGKAAQAHSVPTMTLKVARENEGAIRFYRRLGFTEAARDSVNFKFSIALTAIPG